jgi:spore coat protein CotH
MTIIGGMAALGSNAEMASLDTLMEGPAQWFGPQGLSAAIGPGGIREYMLRRAVALGVDSTGLIPSREQGAQMDQQQQMQQMAAQLGPEALRQYGANTTANQVAETRATSAENIAATKAQTATTAPSTETTQ